VKLAATIGMTKHLRNDLERLERRLLSLGSRVEEAVRKAITSLLERRPDLAAKVEEGDNEIDGEEVEIEEECLKILALHQPVATDLRFVAAVLKINNDLERIGDLAVNIAKRAQSLSGELPFPVPPRMRAMVDAVTRMLHRSLDAFVRADIEVARSVLAEDGKVDGMNRAIIDELIHEMKTDSSRLDQALLHFSVSKNLERIADHATNIAEDVVYMVEGEIIRHNLPEEVEEQLGS